MKSLVSNDDYLHDDLDVVDAFGIHSSIAKTLRKQIKNIQTNNVSFVIGLFGKWGSGKSYIINEMKKQFDQDGNQLYFDIDVWKYNDQPLLRVILLDVLHQSKEILGKNYEEKRIEFINKLYYSSDISLRKIALGKQISFWALVVLIILFSLQSVLIALFPDALNDSLKSLLSNLTSIGIPVALIYTSIKSLTNKYAIELISKINENNSEKAKRIPAFSPEQFEDIFDDLINTVKKKKCLSPEDKVVLIFDNIDRCQPKYAYETLSCIKTYLNKKNFVYIIPCDDEAIKEHLILNKNDSSGREYAEEFLDKIFQATFRIPKLKEVDTDKYILNQLNKTVIKNLGDREKDIIRNVLYYAYKGETPRQIKRFINDFVSYYKIAQETDPENIFLLDNISMFAMMMAIKQKYPSYETIILENYNFIANYYENRHRSQSLKDFNRDYNTNIDTNFDNFLWNIKGMFDKSKSIRYYIYMQQTDDDIQIFNDLKDGTTTLNTINSDNIKVINTFFKKGEHRSKEENVQKSILSYFISDFTKATEEINNLPSMTDKTIFKKNISNLIRLNRDPSNHAYTLSLLLEELSKEDFIIMIKIFKYFECSDFAKNTVLSTLFSLSKSTCLNLFEVILEDSNEENIIYSSEDISSALNNWNFYESKSVPEKNTVFSIILSIIVDKKRFDVIDNSFLEVLINNITSTDTEIINNYFKIIESKKNHELINKRIGELCTSINTSIRTSNQVNPYIENIKFIFNLYIYSSIDKHHEIWTTFYQLLTYILRFGISDNEYYHKSLKISLLNDVPNIDNYLIGRIAPFINELIAKKDYELLNKILNNNKVWVKTPQPTKEILISETNITWIGEKFDYFFEIFNKSSYEKLIDNFTNNTNETEKNNFKNSYSNKIWSDCIKVLQESIEKGDSATLQSSIEVISLLLNTPLKNISKLKNLRPHLSEVMKFDHLFGFELSRIMYINKAIFIAEVVEILEIFKTKYLTEKKKINKEKVFQFLDCVHIKRNSNKINKILNEICFTILFKKDSTNEYFELGKYIFLILKERGKLEDNLKEYPKNNYQNEDLFNEYQRSIFENLL